MKVKHILRLNFEKEKKARALCGLAAPCGQGQWERWGLPRAQPCSQGSSHWPQQGSRAAGGQPGRSGGSPRHQASLWKGAFLINHI